MLTIDVCTEWWSTRLYLLAYLLERFYKRAANPHRPKNMPHPHRFRAAAHTAARTFAAAAVRLAAINGSAGL
jgi:hypothetical protein